MFGRCQQTFSSSVVIHKAQQRRFKGSSRPDYMKCDTNTLSGLQAQLTLIQLCSTSKDFGFVVL